MRAVRVIGTILAAFVVVIATATPSGSGNKASEAEAHLRKACELVWTDVECDRLLRLPSAGRVSATDVHDAGRRRGGLEPIDDVPCVVEGGPPGPLEREAVEEGNGLRSAAATAPTLAYGYLVLESGRDVLLPVLVSGWCESGGGSLGDSRVDDGSGTRTCTRSSGARGEPWRRWATRTACATTSSSVC